MIEIKEKKRETTLNKCLSFHCKHTMGDTNLFVHKLRECSTVRCSLEQSPYQ